MEGRQVLVVDLSFGKFTSSHDLSLKCGAECREDSSSSSDQSELSLSNLVLSREPMAGKLSVSSSVVEARSNPDGEVSSRHHAVLGISVDPLFLLVSKRSSEVLENCSVEEASLIEVRRSIHVMGVHEVLEVLGVHLVSDLRERLPGLHEGRKVLHLPPEVKAFVVDGSNLVVVIDRVNEGVVRSVNNLVGSTLLGIDDGVNCTRCLNGVGLSDEALEVLVNDSLSVFTVLDSAEHLGDGGSAQEVGGVLSNRQRSVVLGVEVSRN